MSAEITNQLENSETSMASVYCVCRFNWCSYLRKCFSEFEACKELSILGILGSDRNASQHKAGNQLEVHFDVKPVGTNMDIWLCFSRPYHARSYDHCRYNEKKKKLFTMSQCIHL